MEQKEGVMYKISTQGKVKHKGKIWKDKEEHIICFILLVKWRTQGLRSD